MVSSSENTTPISPTTLVPPVEMGAHNGKYSFGPRLEHEQLLGKEVHILYNPETHWLVNYLKNGVCRYPAPFRNPPGQRITRIEVESHLGLHSHGEIVQLMPFDQHQNLLEVIFQSKKDHGINYTVRLYGVAEN